MKSRGQIELKLHLCQIIYITTLLLELRASFSQISQISWHLFSLLCQITMDVQQLA